MKKLLSILFLCAVILLPISGWAFQLYNGQPTSNITALATSSGAAVTGPGVFLGIIVQTDGTNNCTVDVYDNTSASGTHLIPTSSVVLGSARVWALGYSPGLYVSNGIYVSITAAGGGTCGFQINFLQ